MTFEPIAFVLCNSGAAIGPQLAGILSRRSWHNVFYMLIAAEFVALLVSSFCEWTAQLYLSSTFAVFFFIIIPPPTVLAGGIIFYC